MAHIPQDPTARASRGLDTELEAGAIPDELVIVDESLIKKTKPEVVDEAQPIPPAEEDVPEPQAIREKARVLFVSYSEDIFIEGSITQKRYASYSDIFEEVHVIVCTQNVHQFDGLQIAQNVWVYPTNSKRWWSYPYDAYQVAARQLHFANAFRVDVVCAEDPFELSFIAYIIAKRYKRALTIEASEHLYSPYFYDENEDNGYRAWWARFVIPRADRVIARSTRLRDLVLRNHNIVSERTDIVPSYIDVAAIAHATPAFTLKERYPKFTFTMLVVAPLIQEANIEFVINAVQHTLKQYPSMGLIIVGDGPLHAQLLTLVRDKGFALQVIFEPAGNEYISFLKSAGMLLSLSTTSQSEEILMCAAALRVPVITAADVAPDGIFTNGESAIVCAPSDIGCVIKGLTEYINNSIVRAQYAMEAESRVQALVAGGEVRGLQALRESLEKAVLARHVAVENTDDVVIEEDVEKPEEQVTMS